MTAKPNALPQHFLSLRQDARSHLIVFRVWDTTSASPLIFTGDPDTSGFRASNPNLGSLSPQAFRNAFARLKRSPDWVDGVFMRQTIIDHVLSRWKSGTTDSPSMPDDLSCWISTTRSLRWAIWEIARRLAIDPSKTIYLAVIHRRQPAEHQMDLSLAVSPHYTLGRYEESLRGIDSDQRIGQDIRSAIKRAEDSYESLYYGRIFHSSTKANFPFTVEVRPQSNISLSPHPPRVSADQWCLGSRSETRVRTPAKLHASGNDQAWRSSRMAGQIGLGPEMRWCGPGERVYGEEDARDPGG